MPWRTLSHAFTAFVSPASAKLAVASSAEAVDVEPQPQAAFATLEVDSATGSGPIGSVVIEAREVAVRLDGAIDASRVVEIVSALRGLR